MEWKTASVEAGDGFSKLALRTFGAVGKEASETRDCCVAKNPSARYACSGQAATRRAARPDPSRDKERLAQDANPNARTLVKGGLAGPLQFRQVGCKKMG
jgi:hypothetical protein